MLTTKEVSSLLNAAGIKLSSEQIAVLARNKAFPNADKDESGNKWIIPPDDVSAFIQLHRKEKARKQRIQLITAGTATLVITILSLLSITKDTVDLVAYIIPTATLTLTPSPTLISTPTPTPTPIPPPAGRIGYYSANGAFGIIYAHNPNRIFREWLPGGAPCFMSIQDADFTTDGTHMVVSTKLRCSASYPEKEAFNPNDSRTYWGLYFIDIEDGERDSSGDFLLPVRIATDLRHDISLDLSPNDQFVVYASETIDGSNQDIYTISIKGTNQMKLTTHPQNDTDPAWSPDGSLIAFSSERDGDFEIFVMQSDGSNQIQLTDNKDDDFQPVWSPDGKFIAFVAEQGGDKEIYIMQSDGSNQIQLTDNKDDDFQPVWSPDGRYIAFNSNRDGSLGDVILFSIGSNAQIKHSTRTGFLASWIE